MVIYTHAILVLEGLRHHVGSDTFALPFGFLGIIGLPFIPLLVLPFIILSPLFGLPFIFRDLNGFRQRDQVEGNLRAVKSCWYCCIKGTLSVASSSMIFAHTALSALKSCWMDVLTYP